MENDENKFIAFWENNRLQQKKSFLQFIKGLSIGLLVGFAIIIAIISGWYTRANMLANSKMSTYILVIALFFIAVFMAWLYQNYQWEANEQKYLELLAKQKKKLRDSTFPTK
jgi:di/tricarboxylate transporter